MSDYAGDYTIGFESGSQGSSNNGSYGSDYDSYWEIGGGGGGPGVSGTGPNGWGWSSAVISSPGLVINTDPSTGRATAITVFGFYSFNHVLLGSGTAAQLLPEFYKLEQKNVDMTENYLGSLTPFLTVNGVAINFSADGATNENQMFNYLYRSDSNLVPDATINNIYLDVLNHGVDATGLASIQTALDY